jgi:hypothetical protein
MRSRTRKKVMIERKRDEKTKRSKEGKEGGKK